LCPSFGGALLEAVDAVFVFSKTFRSTLDLAPSRGVTTTVVLVEGVRLRDKESWRGLPPVFCADDDKDSGDFILDSCNKDDDFFGVFGD
jgi:hypothetical protein